MNIISKVLACKKIKTIIITVNFTSHYLEHCDTLRYIKDIVQVSG